MAWNFADEGEQTTTVRGPVPAGSIVLVNVEPLESNYNGGSSDPCVSEARSGLLQVRFLFTVAEGTYQGVKFYTNISLPQRMQNITLSEGYQKSCNIGGAQLKAMCLAMRKSTTVQKFADMKGWKIPVRVKIKNQPSEGKNGEIFWNNDLDRVIVPSDPEYQEIGRLREMINEHGAVTGNGAIDNSYGRPEDNPFNGSESRDMGYPFPTDASAIDEPPF